MAIDRHDPGTLDWVALHHDDPPAPRAAPRRRPTRRRPRSNKSQPGEFGFS